MKETFAKVEELAKSIKDYADIRIESLKLNAAEKSSAAIANVLAGLFVAAVFSLFIIFSGIALSFGIAEWTGKTWLGFLIVAILYLLLGIVAWTARRRIIQLPVMNAMIRQLFKNDDEED